MPRDPKKRRTLLGGASRWELLGVTAIVVLVAVLASRFWPSQEHSGRYLTAGTGAVVDPSGVSAVPATPSGSPAVAAAATPAPGAGSWWSGAAGSVNVTKGGWAAWRGEPVTVGGTWDNGNQEMVEMHSICPGGAWANWNRPLDVAVGAIEGRRGETWAKAAKGAYDARWRKNLQRIATCWGPRDPSYLFIRFAHEMNLDDMPWQVRGGEEAAFATALTRYSALRYEILPAAKIVLCPSDGTSGSLGIDLSKLWPGTDSQGRQVVQVYAVDTYNSWVVIKDEAEFEAKLVAQQSGVPLGLEIHRMMAEQWGVPFAVSEWAGNGNPKDEGSGADLPIYYRLMNEWFRAHAGDPKNPQPGQLLYEVYFNSQERFTLLPTRYQPRSAQMYRDLTWGR